MRDCYILKSEEFTKFYGYDPFLKFKYQGIYRPSTDQNKSYNAYGAEILMDLNRMKRLGITDDDFNNIIKFGEAANKSIDYTMLLNNFRAIFVNIEKANLCDIRLLKRISVTSQQLKSVNIELVVEITERDFCIKCQRVMEGLQYLKSMQVSLACDDFDYVGIAAETAHLQLEEFYKYVKINVPTNLFEKVRFNQFMQQYRSSKRIIIEQIESESQCDAMVHERVWGLQGFLFCKGRSFPIVPDEFAVL